MLIATRLGLQHDVTSKFDLEGSRRVVPVGSLREPSSAHGRRPFPGFVHRAEAASGLAKTLVVSCPSGLPIPMYRGGGADPLSNSTFNVSRYRILSVEYARSIHVEAQSTKRMDAPAWSSTGTPLSFVTLHGGSASMAPLVGSGLEGGRTVWKAGVRAAACL